MTEECASSSQLSPRGKKKRKKKEVGEERGGELLSAGTFLLTLQKKKKKKKQKKVESQGTAPEMFPGAATEEVCGPVRGGGAAVVSPSARGYCSF